MKYGDLEGMILMDRGIRVFVRRWMVTLGRRGRVAKEKGIVKGYSGRIWMVVGKREGQGKR